MVAQSLTRAQLSADQAGRLSEAEWSRACGAGTVDEVLQRSEQLSQVCRVALSGEPSRQEAIPTRQLREAVEFFQQLTPDGSAKRSDAEHALGLRLIESAVSDERHEGRALLQGVYAAAREFRSPDYQAAVALNLARAEERCGNPAAAERLRSVAEKLPFEVFRPLTALGIDPADEPQALSLPTAALYRDGPLATKAGLSEIAFGKEHLALILGDLADSFHEAWRKIHFSQRGEGAPRWKTTTDQDWIKTQLSEHPDGVSWLRMAPGNSGSAEVDIAALPNSRLPADRAAENFASALVGVRQLIGELQSEGRPDASTVLRIADVIHAAWLERNQYVFDKKYDAGGADDSPGMRLMRLPFDELYREGQHDVRAGAEALKDIEVVIAAMEVLNDAFKAELPARDLLTELKRGIAG